MNRNKIKDKILNKYKNRKKFELIYIQATEDGIFIDISDLVKNEVWHSTRKKIEFPIEEKLLFKWENLTNNQKKALLEENEKDILEYFNVEDLFWETVGFYECEINPSMFTI